MARIALAVERVVPSGLAATYSAANVDGHSITNSGNTILHVKNTDTVAKTVTVITPRQVDGLDVADQAVSVPASSERFIGPFSPETFGNSTNIDYSATTGVTVAALRF